MVRQPTNKLKLNKRATKDRNSTRSNTLNSNKNNKKKPSRTIGRQREEQDSVGIDDLFQMDDDIDSDVMDQILKGSKDTQTTDNNTNSNTKTKTKNTNNVTNRELERIKRIIDVDTVETFDQVTDFKTRMKVLKHYNDTQSGKIEKREMEKKRKEVIAEKKTYNTLKLAILEFLYQYLDSRSDSSEIVMEMDPMFDDVLDLVLTDPEIINSYRFIEIPRNEDKVGLGIIIPRIVRFGLRDY